MSLMFLEGIYGFKNQKLSQSRLQPRYRFYYSSLQILITNCNTNFSRPEPDKLFIDGKLVKAPVLQDSVHIGSLIVNSLSCLPFLFACVCHWTICFVSVSLTLCQLFFVISFLFEGVILSYMLR